MARPKINDRASVRTERVSLVLSPADYDGISTLAQIRECSMNDVINLIVKQVVEKNSDVIAEFNAAKEKASAAVNISVED